jgi:hypothetical protein
VLDSNNNVQPAVNIDNNERIMTIELPNTVWQASRSKTFPRSSVIQGYTVQESGSGILMLVQLKKAARLVTKSTLSGTGPSGKRLVFDIGPQ